MDLNMACTHRAGHKVGKPKRPASPLPVVISKRTLEGIVSRSRQQEKQDEQAAIDEEQKYKQYLKDGNDALMKRFTNLSVLQDTGDDELQAARDTILAEKTKDLETLQLLSEKRKESIMRANRILYLLKPGPRTLRGALLISEMAHQRHAHDALKKEIIEDAQRQQRLDEQQCSGWVIPTGYVTEEQEKAEQKEKSLKLAEDYRHDLEERRQRRLAEKQEKTSEIILERALYKILHELEQMKAKEVAEKKREFCRQAYRDSLQDKAAKAHCKCYVKGSTTDLNYNLFLPKPKKIQEEIEDRINCVSSVTKRNLNMRLRKQTETIREDQHRSQEICARNLHELQQRGKETKERQQETHEEGEADMLVIDEARRQCELEKLAKQRRAYEQVERHQGEEKRLKQAEVRRFQVATRYRNAEVDKAFFNREKALKKKVQDDTRKFLHEQRDEVLEKRQTESMRMTACQEDPYLQDDVDFFQGAVDFMQESKKLGRPLYPLAKAAEVYKRENQVDMVPEGLMLRRNTKRDSCWPGYYGKAKLAFRKYEHREQCRREMEAKRHNIFDNCIKIQSMAAAENPAKPCVPGGIVKCLRNSKINIEPSQESLEFPVEPRLSNTPSKEAETTRNTLETPENTSPIESLKVCTKRTLNTTLTKKMSMESCNRCTGGRNSVPTSSARSCLKVPDLQSCWTPRPQVTNRPPRPQANRPYSTPATLSTHAFDQSPNSMRFRKKSIEEQSWNHF